VPPISGWVWLRRDDKGRNSLTRPYTGPYRVVCQRGPVISIEKGAGKVNVNFDRLKQAKLKNDIHPPQTNSAPMDNLHYFVDDTTEAQDPAKPGAAQQEEQAKMAAEEPPQDVQQHSRRGRRLNPNPKYT
jgi:hypothetical protein